MRHYATLFDSRYVAQGIALYESLLRHSSELFTLWVLALDDECVDTLHRLGLPHLRMVNLRVFEFMAELESIRASRTWQEYCWTLASQWCEFLMEEGDLRSFNRESLPDLTYLDSDVWFMDNSEIAFLEIGQRSIGIVPHRVSDNADRPRLERSGRFNVSLVHFKNNPIGRACLSKWAAQVRERCSVESVGDQLFLDSWPGDYGEHCAIIENIAVGVAPWNLSSYRVTEGPCVDGIRICMYHFHEFREIPVSEDYRMMGRRHAFRLTNYRVRTEDVLHIYQPYVDAVSAAKDRISELVTA